MMSKQKSQFRKAVFWTGLGDASNPCEVSMLFLSGICSALESQGNPLQCSCLENPRDGGAWWAAVSGVTELDMTEAT